MNRSCTFLLLSLVGIASASGQPAQPVSQVAGEQAEPWPIVIAHRGASGYLPEHTTESAAFAHALGADYIEQDCVLSRDQIPVVLHDVTLDKVTNVADVFPDRQREDGRWYVFDFSLSELKQLNVHERYGSAGSPRFPDSLGQFQIATLREHVELIRGLDHSRGTTTGLYIELKQPTRHRQEGLDLAGAILQVLSDFELTDSDDRVFLQCFEDAELRRLRVDLECRLPLIQLLKRPPTADQIREYARYVDGLGVSINCVISGMTEGDDPEPVFTDVIQHAHENAMQVHVWTVRTDHLPDGVDSVDRLLTWLVQERGADGLFSDQPDAVIRWRTEESPGPRTGPFRLIRQK